MGPAYIRLAVACAAALLGAVGCTTVPEPRAQTRPNAPFSKDLAFHIFGVTGQGYALNDVELAREITTDEAAKTADTRIDCDDKRPVRDAEERLRRKFGCMMKSALGHYKHWRERGGPQRLDFVLYFNGGLNKQSNSTQVAQEKFREILDSQRYPVFMIWPTGFRQSYGNAVFETRDAEYVKAGNPENLLTAATQAVSDVAIGVGKLPKSFESDARFLSSDYGRTPVPLSAGQWRIAGGRIVGAGEATKNVVYSDRVEAPAVPPNPPLLTAGLVPIRPVALTLTGVGTTAWDNMVRRTRTTVHNIDEFRPPDATAGPSSGSSCAYDIQRNGPKLRRCFPRGGGAFSRFFHWFSACAKPDSVPANSDGCPLDKFEAGDRDILREARLTMIGHSMGSIVINEIVAAYPDLPYDNIIFMAGADSVRSTYRTVVPLIDRNKGCTRFYNLMLHPYNDANETTAAGAAPRGSLLEYIDHYLTSPKTVDDRTVGKWANVAATKHLFGSDAQRWMLFRIFDRGDNADKTTPLSHGAFNDDRKPFADPAFWNPTGVSFDTPPQQECDGRFFANAP